VNASAASAAQKRQPARPIDADVAATLAWLKRHGTKANRLGMARYAIRSENVFGVSVDALRDLAKKHGRNHELAVGLWGTGWHEARTLASLVDEPARVTPAQMDRWCRDFDNWAICDTVCFHLFDRTPHAWTKVSTWAVRKEEFVKRAAFALLASLALHDKSSGDEAFVRFLPVIERASTDERNFVKKGVSWALRSIGGRSAALHRAATDVARRLASSPDTTARWIGKDAARQLASPAVSRRIAAREKRGRTP
jgi:3-methyladenine DNA glycosylase AlkD